MLLGKCNIENMRMLRDTDAPEAVANLDRYCVEATFPTRLSHHKLLCAPCFFLVTSRSPMLIRGTEERRARLAVPLKAWSGTERLNGSTMHSSVLVRTLAESGKRGKTKRIRCGAHFRIVIV